MAFFAIVRTRQVAILETFGRFTRTLEPGLNFFIPFIQQKRAVLKTSLLQDDFKFEVKTKDNAFSLLSIAVQYEITDPREAYYSLSKPLEQINSHIENTVRSLVPKMTLDELFESQDDICNQVKVTLGEKMERFGYRIDKTLITEIDPDVKIKEAMNQVLADQRLRDAAAFEAEAERIKLVATAQADKERKELQGQGIARQREEIMNGYKTIIEEFSDKFDLPPELIANMSMATQFMDMVERICRSDNAKTIFLPYGPSGSSDIVTQLRQSMMEGVEGMDNKS